MPDDGRRYELLGGAIVMTPSPEVAHQRASRRLQNLLEAAKSTIEVFAAPLDLDLPGGHRVQPDLVMVAKGRTGRRLTPPVELVVEIVSPGSAVNDRVTKLDVYATAGIPHYWIIDLPAGVVSTYVLAGDTYRVLAEGRIIETTEPVAVTIDIAALVDPS
ncbi:MAG: Uma2 family endonuclease [Acidimicrobiales bacterium]